VIAFYQLMFNECRPDKAVEHYVGEGYIQHNLHVVTGRAASSLISSEWRVSGPASESR
jgi:predicted SnoaL-like aldol condensation-catalyzing enzyme